MAEDIEAGELVFKPDDADLRLAEFADGTIDGVAVHTSTGDSIAETTTDATGSYVFEAADDDRAGYGGNDDGDVFIALTAATAGTSDEPAPSIDPDTVVGIIDETSDDAPAGVEGRLVEEGYQADADGSGSLVTFDRDSGNFIALGKATKQNDTTVGADEYVVVERRKDL